MYFKKQNCDPTVCVFYSLVLCLIFYHERVMRLAFENTVFKITK